MLRIRRNGAAGPQVDGSGQKQRMRLRSDLVLVRRHREGGVHMRASLIFSTNDTLANAGVILAGALVAWSGSPIPDLLIGTVISLLVHAARRIAQVGAGAVVAVLIGEGALQPRDRFPAGVNVALKAAARGVTHGGQLPSLGAHRSTASGHDHLSQPAFLREGLLLEGEAMAVDRGAVLHVVMMVEMNHH
jgi:hypothetical protein